MGSMLLKVICGTMFLLGMSWNVMAKEVIKGRVVDSQSKEVLIGATVSVVLGVLRMRKDILNWRWKNREP